MAGADPRNMKVSMSAYIVVLKGVLGGTQTVTIKVKNGCKEIYVAYFKVLSQDMPDKTEKCHVRCNSVRGRYDAGTYITSLPLRTAVLKNPNFKVSQFYKRMHFCQRL
jgi:hypothetical protein